MILLYALCYFLVTRCLEFKKWYIDVFLGAGLIVCFLGILHFFNLDPLGFKAEISPEDYDILCLHWGTLILIQRTSPSHGSQCCYVCIGNGYEKKNMVLCLHDVCIFALIMGVSDNAYLTLFALLGLLPLYLSEKRGTGEYIVILAAFVSALTVIDWIENHFGGRVQEISGVFNLFTRIPGLWAIALLLWTVAVVMYIYSSKTEKQEKKVKESRILWYGWLGLVMLAALGIIFVLYDANIAGNGERYGAIANYVVMDDSWGTERGYVWRLAMEIYSDFL